MIEPELKTRPSREFYEILVPMEVQIKLIEKGWRYQMKNVLTDLERKK